MQITDRSDSDRSLHDTQKGNTTNIYHSNQQQKRLFFLLLMLLFRRVCHQVSNQADKLDLKICFIFARRSNLSA